MKGFFAGFEIPVMAPEVEQLAERGFCPKCYRQGLKPVLATTEMRYMQCEKCKCVAVLRP